MRIAAFILGLLAGLSGFVVMILEAGVGGLNKAVNHTTGGLEGLAVLVLLASILAIVGASLMFAPFARGRGVGERLVEMVVEWARDQQAPRVVLSVRDHNAPAIRLYCRQGFEAISAHGVFWSVDPSGATPHAGGIRQNASHGE